MGLAHPWRGICQPLPVDFAFPTTRRFRLTTTLDLSHALHAGLRSSNGPDKSNPDHNRLLLSSRTAKAAVTAPKQHDARGRQDIWNTFLIKLACDLAFFSPQNAGSPTLELLQFPTYPKTDRSAITSERFVGRPRITTRAGWVFVNKPWQVVNHALAACLHVSNESF
jgi:hypothetical protein